MTKINKKIMIIFSIILIGSFLLITSLLYVFNPTIIPKTEFDNNDAYYDSDSQYSWLNDSRRLNQTEIINNITLIIDFKNDTIETTVNISQDNSFTSVFDLTAFHYQIVYEMFNFGSSPSFLITSIKNLGNNEHTANYWQYWVNEEYSMVACNEYQLKNNDIVIWIYGDNIAT
ncbi:DUF4430 domain-containing protein [Promethearchaeum syntrophicum]|uniref:DUF4430 domain-containing protein n=1 Tax=Promethearchaeum syntrophicum TaxID=2594042 RepID=A0A5B9D7C6_9ARCH|nr:DUF4430 domain-containing protein [Candidatus Prometheoarchaeum syntrophicum]QEE14903.1 hypothetical protein DSAG12_00724 [Candidatus Prometheoarchaeum syntrophicum]